MFFEGLPPLRTPPPHHHDGQNWVLGSQAPLSNLHLPTKQQASRCHPVTTKWHHWDSRVTLQTCLHPISWPWEAAWYRDKGLDLAGQAGQTHWAQMCCATLQRWLTLSEPHSSQGKTGQAVTLGRTALSTWARAWTVKGSGERWVSHHPSFLAPSQILTLF